MATGSGSTRSIQNISCIALVVLRMACFATPCMRKQKEIVCHGSRGGEGAARNDTVTTTYRFNIAEE